MESGKLTPDTLGMMLARKFNWHDYEGVHWLNAVVEEAAQQGLTLTTLDDALERHDVRTAVAELPNGAISWGKGEGLCDAQTTGRTPRPVL